MALTNTGRNLLADALNGDAITPYNAANAYIGVGDSNTAFNAAHTDLQAASNKLRVAMDATFPTKAVNVLTYQATYTTGQANFAWNEWGIFNASSGGTMLCRKVESLGTKTSAQAWQINCAITVSNP